METTPYIITLVTSASSMDPQNPTKTNDDALDEITKVTFLHTEITTEYR